MFERFTESAKAVITHAESEARDESLSHDYIGTEHLLLGLFGEREENLAFVVFDHFGLKRDDVHEQIVNIIGSGTFTPGKHIPFTPRAKKVLELSLREALMVGSSRINPEHILLALIREGEGVAYQILVKLNENPDQVRRRVYRAIVDHAHQLQKKV